MRLETRITLIVPSMRIVLYLISLTVLQALQLGCSKGTTDYISLPKDASDKLARVRTMDPAWTVEPINIWVNAGFYRAQVGDYR